MPSQENERPNRLSCYKNSGKNTEEMRRRRNEVKVELRKARKDDQLFKRRNLEVDELESLPLQEISDSPQLLSLDQIVQGMMSNDENLQMQATQACRKTLSKERHPPIDDVIRAGIVPRCVQFLSNSRNVPLQFEAAWALTNIASGTSEQTNAVVEAGAIPKLVPLIKSHERSVAEQAVWALGNIAGDGPSTRDLVLQHNLMTGLVELVTPDLPASFLRNIVWTISNLCRHKSPLPAFEHIKVCLPLLTKLLNSDDDSVLADSCWALSYLTDGPNERIQAIVDTGMVPQLVQLLASPKVEVVTPALRTVGNIATGSDAQTDSIINAGALYQLCHLLQHPRPNIVKEAAWTVSNVTAGCTDQINQVIEAGVLPPLIQVLRAGDFKSQKEAAWAVTNLMSGGTFEQIASVLQSGALEPMCNLLDSKEWKTTTVILDGLNHILKAAKEIDQVEKVAIMIEECGGLNKLELLQHHENTDVYKKAYSIIETYFSVEDDEDENVAAPSESNGQWNFNQADVVPDGGFSF